MNIYIYGNDTFKKEIHSTLNHANIQFKLDSDTLIKDIDSLNELEKTIKDNPQDIYLIDDEKIIKKNSKIKFLNPKDGIEESFLLDHGIADLSVDSLKEIPKYILRKYEEQQSSQDIQNSIIDIVDEAYENEEKFELDEELSLLLSQEDSFDTDEKNKDENQEEKELEKEKVLDVNLDEIDKILEKESVDENSDVSDEELNELMSFNEDVGLNNISSDYDEKKNLDITEDIKNDEEDNLEDLLDELSNEDVPSFDTIEEKEVLEQKDSPKMSIQGESMDDEFSELDSLNEKDLLEALSSIDETICTTNSNEIKEVTKSENKESLDINTSNVSELSELISKLLQNKTLEITIKIKD